MDVSRQARLDRVVLSGRPDKDHLLDSAGTGVAFLDYDRDGRLDVYVVNGWRLDGSTVAERGRNALYRGLPGGTFEDVTDAASVGGEGQWGSGVSVADFDRDGWPDIFVTNFGPNLLYRNLGNGRFEEVAKKVGVDAPGWNTGAAFFDADGDGFLDLYVASYIDCTLDDVLKAKRTLDWRGLEKVAVGPFGLKGAPDHFFRSVAGKTLRGRDGGGGPPGPSPRLRFRSARRRLRRRRPRRPLRGQRLRPQLSLPQRRQRPVQGDGGPGPGRPSTPTAPRRPAWGPRWGT